MTESALPDYENLSAWKLDRLDGPEREAFYAWRNGDTDKAAEIRAAYDLPPGDLVVTPKVGEPADVADPTGPAAVETAVEEPETPEAPEPDVETAVEDAPEKRTRRGGK